MEGPAVYTIPDLSMGCKEMVSFKPHFFTLGTHLMVGFMLQTLSRHENRG
jgi:hypothetical protein